MKNKLKLPKFSSEKEEKLFWESVDLSRYFEEGDFVPVSIPNLKPSTRPISIRLPESLLNQVKERANELNVPYQSLIKRYIQDGAFA